MNEIIAAYRKGEFKDEEKWYNVKTMKALGF